MIRMKHLTPPGIVVLMALSGPAGAQGDPTLCSDPPDLAKALTASVGLPYGGCPKVQIYSLRGDVRTACVLYFADDDGEKADTPKLDATGDGWPSYATFRTLLAY
jgi:hypothetical protein